MKAYGGSIYDDGVVQIACKIEVRGSQGRVTFYYRNQSSNELSDIEASVNDPANLIRCQLSPLSPTIPPRGQVEQQLLVECMQPAYPAPQLVLSYSTNNTLRTHPIDLPITVASFNEPLSLSGNDFAVRYDVCFLIVFFFPLCLVLYFCIFLFFLIYSFI